MGFMASESFLVGVCGGLFGLLVGVFILCVCFGPWSLAPPPKPIPPAVPPGIRGVKDGIPKPQQACKPATKKFHDVYGIVGCPKCGHQHRYGLARQFLDCYLCSYTFDPELEGRRYESYKKENMYVPNPSKSNPKHPGVK